MTNDWTPVGQLDIEYRVFFTCGCEHIISEWQVYAKFQSRWEGVCPSCMDEHVMIAQATLIG